MTSTKKMICDNCKKEYLSSNFHLNRPQKFCSVACRIAGYVRKTCDLQLQSERMKEHWKKNRDYRINVVLPKINAARKGMKRNPESIRKMVATRKARNNYGHDEKTRQYMSEQIKKGCAKPESKIRKSLATKSYWCRDDYVKKMMKKRMPHENTAPEKQMRAILTELKVPFVEQIPFRIKKNYCKPDFLLPELKTIIQTDGTYPHKYPHGLPRDHRQDQDLTALGYHIIRFWHSSKKPNPYDGKILDFTIQDVATKLRIPTPTRGA